LNALLPALPPGTLAANLIGAYIIGLAVAYFAGNPALSPHWRLLIITGFCGGLTTFSTFSAELVALIQQQRLGWVAATILVHVGGSVAMTLLGIATYAGLRQS
ncbi:MAG: fluoride ion transporter CrcB, partial [Bordetella sp. SCN 68-11]